MKAQGKTNYTKALLDHIKAHVTILLFNPVRLTPNHINAN